MTLKPELIQRLFRFAAVGAIVMVFFMGMNWLLGLAVSPTLAFLIAYPPALALHYGLNKWWTFGCERTDTARQVTEYLVMVAITFVVQYAFFWLMNHRLGLAGWLSAGIANAAQMALTYGFMTFRVFAPVPRKTAEARSQGSAVPNSKRADLVLIIVAVVVIWFQWWTINTGAPISALGQEQVDDYNRLVDGFLDGHTYMRLAVPPELLKLANPYDPAERKGLGQHDLSLYKGHYYLYFGVTPALVAFIPFRLVTGMALPAPWAHWFFCCVGFCAGAACLRELRRRFFPDAGHTTVVLSALAAALGGFTLALLRRTDIWELPIASGYCFVMLFFYCYCRGLVVQRMALGWLAAASFCYGMAIGSRPTYIFGAGVLALPLIQEWWRGRSVGEWHWWPKGRWWRILAVLATPVGLVVSGLLLYNYSRFGNPLEFGLRYQLTGIYQLKAKLFSTDYFGVNFWLYFWSPAQWSRYFPFVKMIHAPAYYPEGYYGIEFVHGLWRNMPVSALALAVPLAALTVRRELRSNALSVCLAFLGVGGAITLLLLGFNTAAARYMADFSPSIFLASGIAILAAEQALVNRERWLRLVRGASWIGLVWAVFFGVMASFSIHGLFRYWHPSTYAKVAEWFNQPVFALERLLGTKHGPIEMRVRFPKDRFGKWEPLLVSGWEYEQDYVSVLYVQPSQIVLGFDHANHGLRMSRQIVLDYDKEHDIRIDVGFLYPPDGHSMYAKMTRAEAAALRRGVHVTVDGINALEGKSNFYDSSPHVVSVGVSPVSAVYGRRFTGEISLVTQLSGPLAEHERIAAPVYGSLSMSVGFNREPLKNSSEPLVVTGRTGRGDALFVEYLGEGAARLGYDHWGVGAWYSSPFLLEGERYHHFSIDMGSLHRSLGHGKGAMAPVIVWMDGRELWNTELPYYDCEADSIQVGSNSIGFSTSLPDFSGVISGITFGGPPLGRKE